LFGEGGDVHLFRSLSTGVAHGHAPTPVGEAPNTPLQCRPPHRVDHHVGTPTFGDPTDLLDEVGRHVVDALVETELPQAFQLLVA
jgi:hypothetical protein